MLGQQKVKDDAHASSANAVELFTRFSGLRDCLLKHLLNAVTSPTANGGGVKVRPTLFPVLTIISKLTAANSDDAHAYISRPQHDLAKSRVLNIIF